MSRDILAFVHVEKAAGTTLIHILRRNFLLRHLDVRPYTAGANQTFGPRDLSIALRLNPALCCIAGHSVKAYSGLDTNGHCVRYISVLREPIKRYLSQYQYVVERRGEQMSFEEFLANDWFANFQTRKFSADGDVDEAKRVLSEQMLLVGTSDRFDEFLVLLADKLKPLPFDPAYSVKNQARNTIPITSLHQEFAAEILERNALDVELYRFVVEELRPRYVREFGPGLEAAVEALRRRNKERRSMTIWPYVDYLYRRCYVEPATGFVRRRNGMRAQGSY